MNIENQVQFYDDYWSKNKPLNSLKLRRATKILEYFTHVKRKINKPEIIDLGCGDGRLAAFIGQFGKTDAIELSKAAVEHAKILHPHVNFFQGNVLEYPFKESNYDVVISQEVIEHIEDQEDYVNVCSKVLKKNGYLILTTPNKKAFNHIKGGSWSKQPIENILLPRELKSLILKEFKIIKFESIIVNFGKMGYFKIVNNRYVIFICRILGLKNQREYALGKFNFGIHLCVFAQKR